MEEQNFDTFNTPNNFTYSATSMDALGAMEYTIVNLLVDATISVEDFVHEIEEAIEKIVSKLQKHPKCENLLLRVAQFESDYGIVELHGFSLIGSLSPKDYKIKIGGCTPLWDATLDCIETTTDYAKNLIKSGNVDLLNTIFFVLTDGVENRSQTATMQSIKDAMDKSRCSKDLESTTSILIGVNAAQCSSDLNDFHRKASFNQYKEIGNIDELEVYVEELISSTSMVLGSGQAASLKI